MKVKVTNRSDSYIGYSIPDMNLTRSFGPYEDKLIDSLEVEKLAYQPGGQELIDSYLMIDNEELAEQISPNYSHEPEYTYTAEDLKRIIKTGSLDEFLDVLDFAPAGAIETIKSLCATLPVTDTLKINAMQERYGINLTHIIDNFKEEEPSVENNGKTRRVAPTNAEKSNSNYKVVRRVDK